MHNVSIILHIIFMLTNQFISMMTCPSLHDSSLCTTTTARDMVFLGLICFAFFAFFFFLYLCVLQYLFGVSFFFPDKSYLGCVRAIFALKHHAHFWCSQFSEFFNLSTDFVTISCALYAFKTPKEDQRLYTQRFYFFYLEHLYIEKTEFEIYIKGLYKCPNSDCSTVSF